MSALAVLTLAVALAMDAFAVAVSMGCALPCVSRGHYLRLAGAFGFFQFFMPVLGWGLGLSVRPLIEHWDHWVAFALLAYIGGSMIRESFRAPAKACPHPADPSRGKTLLLLAIATSIDALAVGLSFAVLGQSPWAPSAAIGVVCAGLTALGLFLGRRLARAAALGRRAELLGGAVLLCIGLKILYEHHIFE